jgi:hypothetical protein
MAVPASSAPAASIQEAWSYQPSNGWRISFPGLLDLEGNLYWGECNGSGVCDLVTSTPEGAIRYRKPLPGSQRRKGFAPGQLAASGGLVISSVEDGIVRAFSGATGAEAWAQDLRDQLCDGTPGQADLLSLQPLVVGKGGPLFIRAHGNACGTANSQHGHWIVALEASSGALRWKLAFERPISGLIADEEGDLYFETDLRSSSRWYERFLISLAPDGRERWRRRKQWSSSPVAAFGGRLFQANREVRRTEDGAPEAQLPLHSPWAGERNAFTLVTRDSVYLLGSPDRLCSGSDCATRLYRFDGKSERPACAAMISHREGVLLTQPILTAKGSVLFAEGDPLHPRLREFSAGGEEVRSDWLPSGRYSGSAALVSDRWIAITESPTPRIVAFAVPGTEPNAEGWVTFGGTMGRTGRPRDGESPVALRAASETSRATRATRAK